MPGPSERPPPGVILDFFDDASDEPFQAPEIAAETGLRVQTVRDAPDARVEAHGGPFEPMGLNAVVEGARDDLQVKLEDSDAALSVEDLPTVEGDASQLRQVFQNLLDNAIEYSGDEPPAIHVGAERSGDEWVLTVEDDGIGIDPDHTDSIFQVFERLHRHDEHPGTGIGLALCERIVERHGGDIDVESDPGEGSTFSVRLPASNPYTSDETCSKAGSFGRGARSFDSFTRMFAA